MSLPTAQLAFKVFFTIGVVVLARPHPRPTGAP
jgi:hypothetical protein